MRAVSRCRLTYEAEYRLVDIFCSVVGAVAAMYCFVLFTVKYFTMPTGQRDDEKCPLVYRFHTALLRHLQSRSMKLSSIRQSVRLSVRPSFGRRMLLRRVCCCAHGGQEISIDYYTAGAQSNSGSVTLTADVGSWTQTCSLLSVSDIVCLLAFSRAFFNNFLCAVWMKQCSATRNSYCKSQKADE